MALMRDPASGTGFSPTATGAGDVGWTGMPADGLRIPVRRVQCVHSFTGLVKPKPNGDPRG
eukprot:scaffold25630_cov59-Phaeocystis_antarctica.AAC.1